MNNLDIKDLQIGKRYYFSFSTSANGIYNGNETFIKVKGDYMGYFPNSDGEVSFKGCKNLSFYEVDEIIVNAYKYFEENEPQSEQDIIELMVSYHEIRLNYIKYKTSLLVDDVLKQTKLSKKNREAIFRLILNQK